MDYKDRESQAFCIDSNGKYTYQSGNDPMNPNGFKRYVINGYEIWAYNYKDARMKYRAGLIHKKLK